LIVYAFSSSYAFFSKIYESYIVSLFNTWIQWRSLFLIYHWTMQNLCVQNVHSSERWIIWERRSVRDCGFNYKYPRSDVLRCSMRLGSSGDFTTTLTGFMHSTAQRVCEHSANALSYRLESAPLRFGSISSIWDFGHLCPETDRTIWRSWIIYRPRFSRALGYGNIIVSAISHTYRFNS